MGAVERVQRRVSFADLERAPEDGRRQGNHQVHRLEAGSYLLVQRVGGDDKVESAVLPGAALRARSIFP
jgi:hypothetical protein